jgi:hypothetical protein
MSINLNIPGFNASSFTNSLSQMNPVSSVATGLGSAANATQSGIMQSLSQLLSSLGQLLTMGAQGGQFQASQGGLNLGNSLGQGQQMGHQGFNLGNSFGQSQQPFSLGVDLGQPRSLGVDLGVPRTQGSQSRDLGSSFLAQPMSTERAVNVLNQNFDQVSGGAETLNRSDLRRIANDPNSSPELRQAARTVLNDPQAMKKLDTADSRSQGGNEMADGRFSKGDLTTVGGAGAPPQSMSTERAAQVLNQNFDKVSGGSQTIDRGDLRRIANDPNSSPELRQAARTVLNDPQAMNKLDTADSRSRGGSEMADGRISKGDLTSVGGAAAPQQSMSTERAAQVLNQNFDKVSGGSQTIDRGDLRRVANDPNSSPELRQAARTVLNDPQAMKKLDTADSRSQGGNEMADGRISKGDLTAVGGAVASQQPMTTERASQVLNQNFDSVSGDKKTVNRDDLRRAVSDPNSSPEVKSAANFLLNNSDAFRQVDTAEQRRQGTGKYAVAAGDGRISREDLTAVGGAVAPQ